MSAEVCLILACVVCLTVGSCASGHSLPVQGSRVAEQLTELAKLSDDPNPAVTRILFTPQDLAARQFTRSLMEEAGLMVRDDSVGNIYGRWEGSDPQLGSVATGSHNDAIPLAGMYDGTLGVIGGIAALAALKAVGYQPRRALEVIMFTSEEPTRFGLSCIGSRAMAGALSAKYLAQKLDAQNGSFLEAANAAGYPGTSHQELLSGALIPHGAMDYFVELHIEQGPYLEQKGLDIGVVTAIAAPAALEVHFHGDGGHAGGQLMPLRNDAGLAGAELALAVEAAVLATGAEDTVGTTGTFEIKPGAVNSVPRDARLAIDIRDIDGPRRDSVVSSVAHSAEVIAHKRKVRHSLSILNQDPPATCGKEVVDAVGKSVKSLGYSSQKMVSRAYHDSLFMSRIAPTGMIFIPCRNGWSHRPDEFASAEAIEKGVKVLALAMAELSGGTWPKEAKGEL